MSIRMGLGQSRRLVFGWMVGWRGWKGICKDVEGRRCCCSRCACMISFLTEKERDSELRQHLGTFRRIWGCVRISIARK